MATLGLALVLGVLAVAQTLGEVFAYRLRWTWVLAMVAAVVVAWTAWTWVARVAPRVEKWWLVPLSIGALAVLAVANSVSAVGADPPREDELARLRRRCRRSSRPFPRGDGDVIVQASSFASTFYSAGLVLALERPLRAPGSIRPSRSPS